MKDVLMLLTFMAIVVSSVVLLFYSIKLKRAVIKNMRVKKDLMDIDNVKLELDEIIKTSVSATNQTIVGELKKEDEFLELEREEAFIECKSMVKSIVDKSQLSRLSAIVNDVDEWIDNRIEYYVRLEKETLR